MRYWVFTSKPEHFKMSEALVPGETLDWPTFARFKFEVGDLVFIYASNPVLQMIGKLEIEELNLSFSEVNPRNDTPQVAETTFINSVDAYACASAGPGSVQAFAER